MSMSDFDRPRQQILVPDNIVAQIFADQFIYFFLPRSKFGGFWLEGRAQSG